MKYVMIACIMLFIAVLGYNRINEEYQRGFNDALKAAYKTNPPSDALEAVCAGLWFGDQQKKYYEKERRRAR